nr:uncharacterized protein At1g43920, Chloroplastic-like [Nicotiana tomentosiformis]
MSQDSCSSQEVGSKMRCLCGMTAHYFTAYTPSNVGRRFYKCPKPDKTSCDYFEWVDEVLSDIVVTGICKLKSQLDAAKLERMKLKEKVEAMEAIIEIGETETIMLKSMLDAAYLERDLLKNKVEKIEATNQLERTKSKKMNLVILISRVLFGTLIEACLMN